VSENISLLTNLARSEHIVTGVPVALIVAVATNKRVVSISSVDYIIPGRAPKVIRTNPSGDTVTAMVSLNPIRLALPENFVVAIVTN
jgi:hypothetical protein